MKKLAALLFLLVAAASPLYGQTVTQQLGVYANAVRGQLLGTATNDTATAGNIGEIVESTVLQGAAVSATTGVANNVTSIALTAGQWLVCGNISTVTGSGTVLAEVIGWISTVSATLPTRPNAGAFVEHTTTYAANASLTLPTGCRYYQLSGTTTVFLGFRTQFSVSTEAMFGYIFATRVR